MNLNKPHALRTPRAPDRRRRKVSAGSVFLYLVVLGFSTAGFAIAFHQIKVNHDQAVTSKQVAERSKKLADSLAAVVKQIQDERERNVLTNCQDINDRHDRTVARLEAIAKANNVTRKQIEPTMTLIDALTPKRDCQKLLASQVQGDTP